ALINLDFADVRTIMSEGGAALMAVGRASGDERARKAAEAAISSALLDVTIDGARGILFNITGGSDLSLFEVNEAAAIIKDSAHPEVNLIFGAQVDETMGDEVRVTVIATGFEHSSRVQRTIDAKQTTSFRPQPATVPQRQQPTQPASVPQRPMTQYSTPASQQPATAPQERMSQERSPQEPPPAPKPDRESFTPRETPREYGEENIEIPTFLRKRGGR
ncbi:MAG: cell division protein FtsZ, partial [Chloroflexota bacterium]